MNKLVIFALTCIIAFQAYGNVTAVHTDRKATVGDIDCILYDVQFNGWKANELRALGYLTEIKD
jgi:cell division protein FtsL